MDLQQCMPAVLDLTPFLSQRSLVCLRTTERDRVWQLKTIFCRMHAGEIGSSPADAKSEQAQKLSRNIGKATGRTGAQVGT